MIPFIILGIMGIVAVILSIPGEPKHFRDLPPFRNPPPPPPKRSKGKNNRRYLQKVV